MLSGLTLMRKICTLTRRRARSTNRLDQALLPAWHVLPKSRRQHTNYQPAVVAAVVMQRLVVTVLQSVVSEVEAGYQELDQAVMAEVSKWLVTVLFWAVKVERRGKLIVGVAAEEVHLRFSGYQIASFLMDDGFGISGGVETARLRVIQRTLQVLVIRSDSCCLPVLQGLNPAFERTRKSVLGVPLTPSCACALARAAQRNRLGC